MLLRATVVLLVILNFGVAVWWAVRGAPGDAAALVDTGPSTLRLVGEPAAAPLAKAGALSAPSRAMLSEQRERDVRRRWRWARVCARRPVHSGRGRWR